MNAAAMSSLRRYVPPREAEERCDSCGDALDTEHRHSFEPGARRIRCACASCMVLYRSVYLRVPERVAALPDFHISDAQWDDLLIPIGLAFFSSSTPAGKTIVQYPGPAGATEGLLRQDAWQALAASNPQLRTLEPDVEALLVNRIGTARQYFIAPIDECYRLVGLVRLHWRGLAGGTMVWGEIARFFERLASRSELCRQ